MLKYISFCLVIFLYDIDTFRHSDKSSAVFFFMVVIIKDLHSKCQCATASGFSYAGQVTDTHTSNEGDTRRKRERETEGEVETTPHRLVPPTPGTQTFVIGRRLLL